MSSDGQTSREIVLSAATVYRELKKSYSIQKIHFESFAKFTQTVACHFRPFANKGMIRMCRVNDESLWIHTCQ